MDFFSKISMWICNYNSNNEENKIAYTFNDGAHVIVEIKSGDCTYTSESYAELVEFVNNKIDNME